MAKITDKRADEQAIRLEKTAWQVQQTRARDTDNRSRHGEHCDRQARA